MFFPWALHWWWPHSGCWSMLHALFFHFMRTVLGAGPSPSLGPHHLRWAWYCLHLPRTCERVCVQVGCRNTVRLVLGRLTCRQTIRVKHTQTHISTHLCQPSCCSKPPHATTKMHYVKKGMWSISRSLWKIHLIEFRNTFLTTLG